MNFLLRSPFPPSYRIRPYLSVYWNVKQFIFISYKLTKNCVSPTTHVMHSAHKEIFSGTLLKLMGMLPTLTNRYYEYLKKARAMITNSGIINACLNPETELKQFSSAFPITGFPLLWSMSRRRNVIQPLNSPMLIPANIGFKEWWCASFVCKLSEHQRPFILNLHAVTTNVGKARYFVRFKIGKERWNHPTFVNTHLFFFFFSFLCFERQRSKLKVLPFRLTLWIKGGD